MEGCQIDFDWLRLALGDMIMDTGKGPGGHTISHLVTRKGKKDDLQDDMGNRMKQWAENELLFLVLWSLKDV